MAEDKNKLVHVDFSKYPDLLKALDKLVQEKDTDRSKFIRHLVRKAYEEHEQGEVDPRLPERKDAYTRQVRQVAR